MPHYKQFISTIAFLMLLLETFAQSSIVETKSAIEGTLLTEKFTSAILRENLVGLNLERNIKVYLPPGYAKSKKAYPVVYYCHNMGWNNEKLFQDGRLLSLLERGFSKNVVNEFILVAADYTSAATGSLYENSIVSGRWLDYTVNEVVPLIDKKFRTLKTRDSRGVIGDFMGARGALKLAMSHAETFSVVYALHPVATGSGYMPWVSIGIDWKKMYAAKSLADLQGNFGSILFLTVCQAFLPNPNRPPFYCDFYMDLENGEVKVNAEKMAKAKKGFHLEETLVESAPNLKSMRGIAIDWGRFDGNQDHVFSNRAFSRNLEDLGVEYEAEEYRGDPFNRVWTDNGRFYARVLPFLSQHLLFEPTK